VHFNFTYTSNPSTEHTACTEPQCLYNGALYLYLYLYTPYGPYSLYRASVSVQECTLPLPIPLLPQWTVQPVQSLSACTTVHFNFTYTSTPPMELQPVQSLSASTTVHFSFTYTSNSPMDRTACTEPQCLYKGALYLTNTSNLPMDRTACTEPQCLYNGALYLHLYLYSPYGPYSLYRVSVPVQRCTLALPIPILPLCTVQPVQSFSACTTVHINFTYTPNPPMDRKACTEPQCLYNGTLYLYLYLYSPYLPYSLYRASVPVQRCTLPLPIPLLPLRTVRPVQSLSACTSVHFHLTYTSTPTMDRTACTETQ